MSESYKSDEDTYIARGCVGGVRFAQEGFGTRVLIGRLLASRRVFRLWGPGFLCVVELATTVCASVMVGRRDTNLR